ncbi:hypothetical protein FX988_02673 [Paraglaciecola mesophila]|uniref:Orphan protein n=1 Tax=Paraglaciecola mesophila TaxID=197222 RepID=A0A857JLM9_9ALTE|nr:DUF6702 family protein [Paraglaciecola mesophila]QHJ12416.1 hypothetical protein FX988_02673 [Paraglaciecola mesophila]
MSKFLTRSITVLLLIAASSVFAHQQKTAISTILFNPRTENIEVMHRFNLHDAEHAVRHIFGKNADIIGSTKTQRQFSEYVSKRFAMSQENGQAILLKSAGFEIDGKFFWVYQETAEPEQLDNLVISHNALRDLWPSQINTINVEGKGDLQTLTFEDSIELLKVEFDHH